LISFPRGTEMFQFPRLPSFAPMYSARDDTALPVPGFPIRASAGQSLFSSSPRLIAAVHALPRLLMPRHPPCALTILTVIVDSRRSSRHLAVEPCAGYNGDLQRHSASKLALRRFRCLANCAVFKVRRGRNRGDSPAGLSKLSSASPPDARESGVRDELQARSTFRDVGPAQGRHDGLAGWRAP
jgi:hypothetical protein